MWQKPFIKFYDCDVKLREKCFLAYHKQKRLFLHLFIPVCLFSLSAPSFIHLLTMILVKHCIAKDSCKDDYSNTGLDHCSRNRIKTFTSNNLFADRTKDLQNASLHSLVFLLSINAAFTMKFFAESALPSK